MVQRPSIVEIGGNNEILVDPPSHSRVSGSSEECLLQSQIVTTEVMAMYIEGKEKLRKTLKDIFLEDHEWDLKSYDCHGKPIVVLDCRECKDFGGIDGQHTKGRISNLFSNFKINHIMSNQHIRSWCLRKWLDCYNHLQSIAKGKKFVILTLENHKQLVREAINILNGVNDSIDPNKHTFEVIGGSVDTTELKSFWWKSKCVACEDIFS